MGHQIECETYFNHQHMSEFDVAISVKVGLTILYSIIFVAGVFGNSLTIKVAHVLQKKGYLQKSVTDHMTSLSCADLLVLILGIPVELYIAIWNPFLTSTEDAACKIYHFLFESCSYATILHVATLSFERYIAICHPLKFKSVSGSRTVKLICFVWLTSFCVALPLLFSMGVEDPIKAFRNVRNNSCDIRESNKTICTNLSSHQITFQLSVFSAFILYVVILVSVAFMCKKMMKTLIGMKSNASATESKNLPKHGSTATESSRKQSIIFLVLIVVSLAVCWTPIQIRRIMAASKAKSEWTMPYFRTFLNLLPVSDTLFYLSSVLNPLLYSLSSKQFRAVFMQVLRCKSIEHVNMRTLRRTYINPKSSTTHSTSSLFRATLKFTHSCQKADKNPSSTAMKDPDVDDVELEPLSHHNCDARMTKPDPGFNTINSVSGPSLLKTNSELPFPERTSELHLIQQPNGVNETEI
ncbi:G-protein coupled receptor 39 [Scyliorhinus canicula]|uniref:G-protein coupled receptor 39 n=1 Tax=Scyliorhinus canicula TaxID=7830 RepID=UPI0018F6E00A|nr:G-protein coupled receptor 39 [Scyliorhinus canicula]